MAITRCLVFYSWQTDLPSNTNRNFIERALKNAANALINDGSLQVEPVVDRDTVGVPGSPNISDTIFSKIDQAHVFVCDVSIINQNAVAQNADARPTPNPNVLVELGYAMKTLGARRIIMVFNSAYGKPEQLPFDLRLRRVTTYWMPTESEDRATERKRLEGTLVEALRASLAEVDIQPPTTAMQPTLAEQARVAINTSQANQVSLVRKYMGELANTITAMTPTFASNESERWDEQLVQAIDESTDAALVFSQLAEAIVTMRADEAARSMYEGFARILDLYTFSPQFQGYPNQYSHDLAKFLGHELFVTFFSFLIQEGRWELIADLLNEDLQARTKNFGPTEDAPFYALSQGVPLLQRRKERLKSDRMSLHFDLLAKRHAEGDLAKFIPMEAFAEADFFLYLRSQLQPVSTPEYPLWAPWSMLAMRQLPSYLRRAVHASYAVKLLGPLGVKDTNSLRARLKERTDRIISWWGQGHWHYALAGFDYDTIASR
jgi:hypothetical protein